MKKRDREIKRKEMRERDRERERKRKKEREKEKFYVTKKQTERGRERARKEGNVLFNNALNTFYLRLYGIRHSDSDRKPAATTWATLSD